MKYKLVIFDWDGTLMDSTGKIVDAIQHAAQVSQLMVPSHQQAADIIGLSLTEAFERLFPQADNEQLSMVGTHYRAQYNYLNQTPSPMFAGATELLHGLYQDQRQLAVATGKSRRGLELVLAQSGLGHLLTTSRTGDEARSKPDADMLLQIIDQLKVDPADTLMVGDSQYDMEMAVNAGVDRIGVSFGVHDAKRLAPFKPLTIVDCLSEIRDWV